jgi:hypothetical protein
MKGQRKTSDEAHPLPYSTYPKAADVSQHGIQPLPESLPLVDFARAAPHRSSPTGAIEVNEEVLAQSLAILDGDGRVIGAAFNQTMGPFDVEPPLREDDPFLDTVISVWEPVYGALGAQDAAALTALSERYPEFREAYEKGKVTHHFLIARSDDLPKEDTFELVAAGAERCRALGYEYMVTEATNQWTGAAFEALGGVRVHFRPFLVEPAVPKSAEPLEDATTSPNGFLSDKDSGGMFYVIRLS